MRGVWKLGRGWSAETSLLIECCRGCETEIRATSARRPIDWTRFVALAEAARLGPIAYGALKRSPEGIPPDSLEALRNLYMATAAANLRQMHRLGDVLRRFAERSITVMVLKGMALVALVYIDPGLRPMLDIDLLVHRDDLRRAADVLDELGITPPENLPYTEEEYERRFHHWAPRTASDGSLALEIHHDLVPPDGQIRVAINDLWDRAQAATLAGKQILTPSAADLLLNLCLNAMRDFYRYPLFFLADISRAARCLASQVDWRQLAETARQWNASREVYCQLSLTQKLLPAGIPVEVLENLRRSAALSRDEAAAIRRELQRGWLDESRWNLLADPDIRRLVAVRLRSSFWPRFKRRARLI